MCVNLDEGFGSFMGTAHDRVLRKLNLKIVFKGVYTYIQYVCVCVKMEQKYEKLYALTINKLTKHTFKSYMQSSYLAEGLHAAPPNVFSY